MTTTHVTTKTNGKVLPDLTAMQARLEQLEAQNAALVAAKNAPLTCKVAPKGGISVYGLQRHPVTLYIQQWERLSAYIRAGNIDTFAEKNKDKLTTKD